MNRNQRRRLLKLLAKLIDGEAKRRFGRVTSETRAHTYTDLLDEDWFILEIEKHFPFEEGAYEYLMDEVEINDIY